MNEQGPAIATREALTKTQISMRLKPDFFCLICLALCFDANATDSLKAPTHCKPNEEVVFSCPFKNGKTVSLCASPDLSKQTGTLQYRFGRIGRSLELSYPQPIYHPSVHFLFNSSHGGQWAQYDLSFSVNRFKYEVLVQTNSAISDDHASLNIYRDGYRIATMECRYDISENNMWLLEELGIRLHP